MYNAIALKILANQEKQVEACKNDNVPNFVPSGGICPS